jgi:thiol:disulfide interchange protein DsbD
MRRRNTTLRRIMPALAIAVAAAASASVRAQEDVRVETEWIFDADAAHPASTVHAALRVKIQENWHVHSNRPLEDFLIPTLLTVTSPEGIAVRAVFYPEAVMLELEFSEEPLAVFENDFVVGIALDIGPDVAPGTYYIGASLQYQACDDKSCQAPNSLEMEHALQVVSAETPITKSDSPLFDLIDFSRAGDGASGASGGPALVATFDEDCDVMAVLEDFTVVATTGGYMKPPAFLQFIDDAEAGVAQKSMFADKGLLAIMALIIVGGVLLNLTPCVLPLIPINLAIIGAGAQSGSRIRGFALGGTYGLAMALVYGILGLVVILTASTFGQINSTIWFNVAIAILFVVLALAMFDIIHIDFSKYQSKLNVSGAAKTGTFALAFFMGAVTALLAGACVAPVVIQVIVYSGDLYAKGTTIALALPFLLGVGLALPWPIAGAGIAVLPKPGMWMVRVKQALGVFILAFAAYYGYLAWEIYHNTRGVGEYDPAAEAELEGGWTRSLCQGLATAQANDQLVLVDMWATWCKNCLAMDKTTFKDQQVVDRLDDYVKVKFQAEKTGDPPAKDLLQLFNGQGLPTYAILRPKSDTNPTP